VLPRGAARRVHRDVDRLLRQRSRDPEGDVVERVRRVPAPLPRLIDDGGARPRECECNASALRPSPAPQGHTLGGHEIPAGTVVLVSTYGLHHNPSVYPDPERFDPDRFAPEAEAARHRSAWLPFGNGQRVCIGNHFALLEGQIVLAALAHRVAFEPKPGADVKPAPAATLRPSGGMPMIVRRRDLARANRRTLEEGAQGEGP